MRSFILFPKKQHRNRSLFIGWNRLLRQPLSALLSLSMFFLPTTVLSSCRGGMQSRGSVESTESFSKEKDQMSKHSFFAMDTVISMTLYGNDSQVAIQAVEQKVRKLDTLWSASLPHSEISRINQAGGSKTAAIDPRTLRLLQTAEVLSAETQGAFDITLGNLIDLWGIGTEEAHRPTEEEINIAIQQSGQEHMVLDDQNLTLTSGAQLNLGAIAKGATADEIASLLATFDLQGGFVSLGGNVIAIGTKLDNSPWRIGIQNPREHQSTIGYIEIDSGTVVTSGDYERYFEQGGIRYHHILNPRTGFPADSDLASVSVFHQNSTSADAYTTALFVMGAQDGYTYAVAHNLNALFISKDGTITMTPTLTAHFTLSTDA